MWQAAAVEEQRAQVTKVDSGQRQAGEVTPVTCAPLEAVRDPVPVTPVTCAPLETVRDPVPARGAAEGAVGGAGDQLLHRARPPPLGIHNRYFLPEGQSPRTPRRHCRRSRPDSAPHRHLTCDQSPSPAPSRSSSTSLRRAPDVNTSGSRLPMTRGKPAVSGVDSGSVRQSAVEAGTGGGEIYQEGHGKYSVLVEKNGESGISNRGSLSSPHQRLQKTEDDRALQLRNTR